MKFTDFILPVIIVFIIVYGLLKKVDIFTSFIDGAKKGLKNAYEICPALIILLVSVGMIRSSGAIDFISQSLKPFAEALGFPVECIPLAILRPVSGSGSIALLEDVLINYGPDSLAGKTASILVASSETTFYVFAVYFASVKVKKTRHALASALIGDFVGVIATAVAIKLFF